MKKSFTLIELLVVIAIIAILASMLLPALQKAQDKAKASKCINTIKQFTLSFAAYANDFDYMPLQSDHTVANERGHVFLMLADKGYLQDRTLSKKGCTVPRPRQIKKWPKPEDFYYGWGSLYGYNTYLGTIGEDGQYTETFKRVCKPVKLGKVVNPAIKIACGDFSSDADAGSLAFVKLKNDVLSENAEGRAFYCHNYRVNLGYIDGHAGDMAYTDVTTVHSYHALPSSTAYFLFPDYKGTQSSN
jgi:prepilin-type N-terminal cleavage/methylation domain-containing protein